MRSGLIAAFLAAATLGGCATAQGMGHEGMSHEEMMRHCAEMRAQHTGEEPPTPQRH